MNLNRQNGKHHHRNFKQLNIAVKNYHFDTQESMKFETLLEILWFLFP